jgi:UDP-2,3-diacylglucosamine hydrolase
MVRDPAWQKSILEKPLKERLRIAAEARRQSLEQTINMNLSIMDVNQEEVIRVIRKHEVDILVHGHTHRPDVHTIDLGRRTAKRIVLGDWYTQGSVLRWDLRGPKLQAMPR